MASFTLDLSKDQGESTFKMKQAEKEAMNIMLKAKVFCCFGSVSCLIETDACTYQEGLPLAKRA